MVIEVTMAQLVGFVMLVALVGPSIFWVGRLTQRVSSLEKQYDQILEELHAIRDRLPGSA